jgi:hypothetical protein
MSNFYLYVFILFCFIIAVSYFNTYMSSYSYLEQTNTKKEPVTVNENKIESKS